MNLTQTFNYLREVNTERYKDIKAVYLAFNINNPRGKNLFLAFNPGYKRILMEIAEVDRIYKSMESNFFSSVEFLRECNEDKF